MGSGSHPGSHRWGGTSNRLETGKATAAEQEGPRYTRYTLRNEYNGYTRATPSAGATTPDRPGTPSVESWPLYTDGVSVASPWPSVGPDGQEEYSSSDPPGAAQARGVAGRRLVR